jgi:tRNA(fMet)-specific endonuclease VapC
MGPAPQGAPWQVSSGCDAANSDRRVPVDEAVARRFGELRAELLDLGRPTSTPDLLIAATAIVHDLTLVTHNTKYYEAVGGLRVVDWL